MKIICLNFCLLLISSFTSVNGQVKNTSKVYAIENNKVLVWEFNGTKYGVLLTNGITISKDPQNGLLLIGLTHSGYSGTDPDGKNAFLSFTFKIVKDTLTNDEIKDCRDLNVKFESENLGITYNHQIDISLQTDKNEEDRIKHVYDFPKHITVGSNIPVQINWKNVDGRNLYDYLTSAQGLALRLSPYPKISLQVNTSISFNKLKGQEWWNENAGQNNTLILKSFNMDALIRELFDDGVFTSDNSIFHDNLVDTLRKRLTKILVKVSYGKYKINKNDFFATNWNCQETENYSADVDIDDTQFFPGLILKNNPGMIKDLTTDENKGLEILNVH